MVLRCQVGQSLDNLTNTGKGESRGEPVGQPEPRTGGKQKCIFYTKNLQSIASPERLQELLEELECTQWDALMATETWRSEKEEWMKLPGGHRFLGSGGLKGQRGVAIILHERWRGSVKGHRAVSERLAWVDVNMHGKKFRLVVAYFPHAGYGEAEVDKLYAELAKVRKAARREGRKIVVGGDFNAVLGVARAEDPGEAVGKFGLGEQNTRGQKMLRWAVEDELVVANTLYMKTEEKRWTHIKKENKRQIDFICVDKKCVKWVTDAEANGEIGVGNDHRAVRVTMTFENRRSGKMWHGKSKKRPMVGWQPKEPEVYTRMVDEALSTAEAEMLEGPEERTLQQRCERIEGVLAEVAATCKKQEQEELEEPEEESSGLRLRELLDKRRAARAEGGAGVSAVAEVSKLIQREVRKKLRRRKHRKISKILSEFRGLRHIADARSHGVKRGMGSVKGKNGELKTSRQEVADAFAEFYEALYASRREERKPLGVPARSQQEVEKITTEEVRKQLKRMARGKAAD